MDQAIEAFIEAAGERLLVRQLSEPFAIAGAVKGQDIVALAGAALIASRETTSCTADTQPDRREALRRAVALYHAKGYGILRLDSLLREAEALLVARATTPGSEAAPYASASAARPIDQ